LPFNELRKDFLLDRWVVIATERARRPTDFTNRKIEAATNASCPLCSGNEHMTPPAVLIYLPQEHGGALKETEHGDFRYKNWLIRVIPNLFPAFSPPVTSSDAQLEFEVSTFGHAVGHHEVLVESPTHDEQPSVAALPQLVNIITAYKDRLREMSQKPYVKYVQIFRNYGLEAGASLSHAHSQIIATPFVPTIVNEEMETSKSYFIQNQKCVFCELIKKESDKPRQILDSKHFFVFAPYASINPMEFWIFPKRHSANPLDLSEEETIAFAETLKSTLGALKNLVNDPPYNYGIHLAINKDASDYYHWHLEVYPRLSIWAGFEKSTGTYINTITPETAAAELKKLIQF
jgi:UDPglucose--hexose-1-phosphate uridylyltransferase